MLQSIPVTEVTEQRKVYKDPLTDTVRSGTRIGQTKVINP